MFWSKFFVPCTLSAVQSWTFRTKAPSAKTKLNLAGPQCFCLTNGSYNYAVLTNILIFLVKIFSNFESFVIFFFFFSANSERTRKQQSSLKPPTSCLTPLNHTTCGTILHAGLRSAAGVCRIMGEKYNAFLVHSYLTTFSFCRWTQSSHTPGQTTKSETSARSLVEFCELVDFLLDIVSLVSKIYT